jgi:hypothetical protein
MKSAKKKINWKKVAARENYFLKRGTFKGYKSKLPKRTGPVIFYGNNTI